jgi:hypothetical protein
LAADYYSGNHPSLCTHGSSSPQTGPDRLSIHPDEIFPHIKSTYSLLKAADGVTMGHRINTILFARSEALTAVLLQIKSSRM